MQTFNLACLIAPAKFIAASKRQSRQTHLALQIGETGRAGENAKLNRAGEAFVARALPA